MQRLANPHRIVSRNVWNITKCVPVIALLFLLPFHCLEFSSPGMPLLFHFGLRTNHPCFIMFPGVYNILSTMFCWICFTSSDCGVRLTFICWMTFSIEPNMHIATKQQISHSNTSICQTLGELVLQLRNHPALLGPFYNKQLVYENHISEAFELAKERWESSRDWSYVGEMSLGIQGRCQSENCFKKSSKINVPLWDVYKCVNVPWCPYLL